VKRFRFRLWRVLDVRKIRERVCEVEFARSKARLADERRVEQQLESRFSGSAQDLAARLRDGFRPDEVLGHESFLGKLKADAQEQSGRVTEAAGQVEAHHEELLSARQRRKALERLRQRQYSGYLAGLLAEDQKSLDDSAKKRRR